MDNGGSRIQPETEDSAPEELSAEASRIQVQFVATLKANESIALTAPKVEANLATLAAQGVDRDKLLRSLVLSVTPSNFGFRPILLTKVRDLRDLAVELRNTATKLESTFADSTNSWSFWMECFLPQYGIKMVEPERMRNTPANTVASLRKFADALEIQATGIVSIVKSYPRIHHLIAVYYAMREIYLATEKYQDELLADLLQSVHVALGSEKEFSGEQLRKLRNRYLKSALSRVGQSAADFEKTANPVPVPDNAQ